MKNIYKIENENTFFDSLWVHLRGLFFLILVSSLFFLILNMSVYYLYEINHSKIENIRYCPNCSYDLLI